MDSSVSVQRSFFEDHLPRDFPNQSEFSGSDSNMMEDNNFLYGMYYVFDNFPLRKG